MGSNKEWVQKAMARTGTCPVPFNFAFSPVAQRMAEVHYGGAPIEDVLDFPIRMTGLNTVKPLYAEPERFGATVRDEFGVVWTTNEIDRGSPIGPCLAGPNLSGYVFPDPAAPYRYDGLAEWCERNGAHYTIVWVGDLWERATFMRGMEGLLEDVVLAPGFVEALLRGLTDYILRTMEILFERCRFDGIAVSDDYGTQKSLLVSPDSWRRLVKPCLAEIYALAKANGRAVFHHTCGNVRDVIRDMIDIGLDFLHPIQPETMDVYDLKREFGRHVTLWGGLRTQDLLPNGSPAQVRAEVRRLKREMGEGGGYVLEPGIIIQADVPLANMAALIDEAVAGRP
jgi:uroporphyrinogen decarboxylase